MLYGRNNNNNNRGGDDDGGGGDTTMMDMKLNALGNVISMLNTPLRGGKRPPDDNGDTHLRMMIDVSSNRSISRRILEITLHLKDTYNRIGAIAGELRFNTTRTTRINDHHDEDYDDSSDGEGDYLLPPMQECSRRRIRLIKDIIRIMLTATATATSEQQQQQQQQQQGEQHNAVEVCGHHDDDEMRESMVVMMTNDDKSDMMTDRHGYYNDMTDRDVQLDGGFMLRDDGSENTCIVQQQQQSNSDDRHHHPNDKKKNIGGLLLSPRGGSAIGPTPSSWTVYCDYTHDLSSIDGGEYCYYSPQQPDDVSTPTTSLYDQQQQQQQELEEGRGWSSSMVGKEGGKDHSTALQQQPVLSSSSSSHEGEDLLALWNNVKSVGVTTPHGDGQEQEGSGSDDDDDSSGTSSCNSYWTSISSS
ncbi:hypothetical protein FOZ62_014027 [Perkinsus olseni]|uniref:Uncharacterized protein n=1 Tax=Perkinsus olseni TaxID=32597 RepID=A0A7J6U7N6_PEROL|nr:hypothetical protein FOZ62_014027 [Perkinsus olseni]